MYVMFVCTSVCPYVCMYVCMYVCHLMHCNIMLCYVMPFYVTLCYGTVLYDMVLFGMVSYGMVWYMCVYMYRSYLCMHFCMYACMDGWMAGWLAGRTDGWMDGRMHVCMYFCVFVYLTQHCKHFTCDIRPCFVNFVRFNTAYCLVHVMLLYILAHCALLTMHCFAILPYVAQYTTVQYIMSCHMVTDYVCSLYSVIPNFPTIL